MSKLKENKIMVDNPIFKHLTVCLQECMEIIRTFSKEELEELEKGFYVAMREPKEYVNYLKLKRKNDNEYEKIIKELG